MYILIYIILTVLSYSFFTFDLGCSSVFRPEKPFFLNVKKWLKVLLAKSKLITGLHGVLQMLTQMKT